MVPSRTTVVICTDSQQAGQALVHLARAKDACFHQPSKHSLVVSRRKKLSVENLEIKYKGNKSPAIQW